MLIEKVLFIIFTSSPSPSRSSTHWELKCGPPKGLESPSSSRNLKESVEISTARCDVNYELYTRNETRESCLFHILFAYFKIIF